jgi:hypothetical protein
MYTSWCTIGHTTKTMTLPFILDDVWSVVPFIQTLTDRERELNGNPKNIKRALKECQYFIFTARHQKSRLAGGSPCFLFQGVFWVSFFKKDMSLFLRNIFIFFYMVTNHWGPSPLYLGSVCIVVMLKTKQTKLVWEDGCILDFHLNRVGE